MFNFKNRTISSIKHQGVGVEMVLCSHPYPLYPSAVYILLTFFSQGRRGHWTVNYTDSKFYKFYLLFVGLKTLSLKISFVGSKLVVSKLFNK